MILITGVVGSIDLHLNVEISDVGRASVDGSPTEASSKNLRGRQSCQPIAETAVHNCFLNPFIGPIDRILASGWLEIKADTRKKILTGNAARPFGLTQP